MRSPWVRVAVAVGVLAVLLARVGAGPFVDGIRLVDGWAVAGACGLALLTTVCCSWRWHLVARGIGVTVPVGGAVAAYYRSQLLNLTLPGGVVGDVHRAVRHGREVGDLGRSARAVVWERSAGQLVQITLSVLLLLLLPSPVRGAVPALGGVLVVLLAALVLVARRVPQGGASRWTRTLRTAADDVRRGLLAQRAWPGVALASALVVAGHTATFLLAARTAGASAPLVELVPLALLVLAATALPIGLGGWGPREGVAAWAFAAAGLGAGLGVTTAVVYGVLVLVASLPGAVVLVADTRRRPGPTPVATAGAAVAGGGAHG